MDDEFEKSSERIKDWFEGKRRGPIKLKLFLTYRCNLNCKFCKWGIKENKKKLQDEVSTNKWLNLIDSLAELGCEKVDITGGEPFVRGEDTLRIMERVKENEMHGHITTNGTLLNSDSVRRIVEMGWDGIQLSIDAPDAETHDYFRGRKGTFGRSIKTLKLFKKWKERLNKDKPGFVVASVLARWNKDKIREMIELSNFFDVQEYMATPLFADFPEIEKYKVAESEEIISRKTEKWKTKAEEYNLSHNFDEVKENERIIKKGDKYSELKAKNKDNKKTPICFEPWLTLRIDAQGWATFCPSQRDDEKILDVGDNKIKDIWFSEEFDQVRKAIKNRRELKKCQNCCFNVHSDNMKIYNLIENKL